MISKTEFADMIIKRINENGYIIDCCPHDIGLQNPVICSFPHDEHPEGCNKCWKQTIEQWVEK